MEDSVVGTVIKFGNEEQLYPISFVFNAAGELIQSCRHNRNAMERLGEAIEQPDKVVALSEIYAAAHAVVKEALRRDRPLVRRGIHLGTDEASPLMDVIVEPVEYEPRGRLFLVTIFGSDHENPAQVSDEDQATVARDAPREDARQLHEMRERFRRHVSFYKRLVEKARSSYEELRLVSLELNASKHALRILSEQLSIANIELGSKISDVGIDEIELPEVRDLRPIAVLLLDRKLVLRSFSLTADAPFSLSLLDNGRALSESLNGLRGLDILLRESRIVTKSGMARDLELMDVDGGTRCVVQILPHRDATGRLDGALALFFESGQTLSE